MIRSMTGFSSKEVKTEHYQISLSLKSVNSRYLDMFFVYPDSPEPISMEMALREQLRNRISRGKLTLVINVKKVSADNQLTLNQELTRSLVKNIQEIRRIRKDIKDKIHDEDLTVNALYILNFP